MKARSWANVIWGCAALGLPTLLITAFHTKTPEIAPVSATAAHSLALPTKLAAFEHDPGNVCSHLYRSICQKRGETRDPTGVVRPDVDGELQALRHYEEIIHEHPDWSSEQVDNELVSTIFTPKRRNRLQAAYRWVEHSLEQFINRQPESVFTAAEKRTLKARLRKTELELPPPASTYADEPDLFTKNDVFYERMIDGRMRMRVGGAYILSVKSWFNMIFTLAHEFAHAIDPCELRAARISIPAYDRLSACFMTHGLIAVRPTRRECGQNDQLSETFADWVAVQISAVALKTFATEFHGPQLLNAATNSVRDLCEQEDADELDLEFHPSPEVRIDRIFARNPQIREVLGCSALTVENDPFPEYCSFHFQFQPKTLPGNGSHSRPEKM